MSSTDRMRNLISSIEEIMEGGEESSHHSGSMAAGRPATLESRTTNHYGPSGFNEDTSTSQMWRSGYEPILTAPTLSQITRSDKFSTWLEKHEHYESIALGIPSLNAIYDLESQQSKRSKTKKSSHAGQSAPVANASPANDKFQQEFTTLPASVSSVKSPLPLRYKPLVSSSESEDLTRKATVSTNDSSRQGLEKTMSRIVDQIMEEFWAMFNGHGTTGIVQSTNTTSSTSKGKGKQVSEGTGISAPPSSSNRKRQNDDQDEAGEYRDGSSSGPRKHPTPPETSKAAVKFACHFRKHDPEKYSIYSHHVCSLTPWYSLARLKEHLYRKHQTPPYCKRCWRVFDKSNDLESHETLSKSEICEASEGQLPEGITPKLVREIKSKARSWPGQTEEDKWREIYKKLFPGEEVPSPYFEMPQEQRQTSPTSQGLADYENYERQALPSLVESRVAEVVDRDLQLFAAFMRSNLNLAEIIRECQEQVSREYRNGQPSRTSANLPSDTPIAGTSQNTMNNLGGLDQQQHLPSDSFEHMLPAFPPGEPLDWGMHFPPLDNMPNSQEQYAAPSFTDSGYSSQPVNDGGSSLRNFSEVQGSALPQPRQDWETRCYDTTYNLGSSSNFEQ